jgi:hypothetical protein
LVGVRSPSRTGRMTGEITIFLEALDGRRVAFGGLERPCQVISLKGLLFSIRSAGKTRGVSACQLVDAPSPMMAPDSRVRRNVPIGIWSQRFKLWICLRDASPSLADVLDNARGSATSASKNDTSSTSCNSIASAGG